MMWVVLIVSCVMIVDVMSVRTDFHEMEEKVFLAYSAYCGASSLETFTCYWCKFYQSESLIVTKVIYDAVTDTFGYVGHQNGIGYVVFRGTVRDHVTNWITDLTFTMTAFHQSIPGAKVHSGFLTAYKSVHAKIVEELQEYQRLGIHTIIFVGHSLGGALSTIGAADIGRREMFKNINLWTFGSPRVGNFAFTEYLNTVANISIRTVNQKDIVPHVPSTLVYYHHVSDEFWFINNTASFVQCDYSGEDPNCSSSISIFGTSVQDHLTYLGHDERDGHAYGCHGETPGFLTTPISELRLI
jgi:hypothetical protein